MNDKAEEMPGTEEATPTGPEAVARREGPDGNSRGFGGEAPEPAPETDETECSTCGGTGACPTCEGSGNSSEDDAYGKPLACPMCSGTGDCPDCDGLGDAE